MHASSREGSKHELQLLEICVHSSRKEFALRGANSFLENMTSFCEGRQRKGNSRIALSERGEVWGWRGGGEEQIIL